MPLIEHLPEHLKAPPDYLSAQSKEFFLHCIATGSYDAPARDLLITYCEVVDRMDEIRTELREKGRYFNDKHGQPREHPNNKEFRGLINEKGKLFRLLGWDQAPDGGQMPLFAPLTRGPVSHATH